jgi:hypothetical protein
MNDPLDAFILRILGMMKDYGCTIAEAMEWDFESFGFDIRHMDEDLVKDEFQYYLVLNGIIHENKFFDIFTEIFTGDRDYILIGEVEKT